MCIISQYELENVKQLNFSLQMFESDNIEFEKKGSDLYNSLQEEICLKGVLLAKKQSERYEQSPYRIFKIDK
jgi:hypothetical protein